jgi:hypothetical protein
MSLTDLTGYFSPQHLAKWKDFCEGNIMTVTEKEQLFNCVGIWYRKVSSFDGDYFDTVDEQYAISVFLHPDSEFEDGVSPFIKKLEETYPRGCTISYQRDFTFICQQKIYRGNSTEGDTMNESDRASFLLYLKENEKNCVVKPII